MDPVNLKEVLTVLREAGVKAYSFGETSILFFDSVGNKEEDKKEERVERMQDVSMYNRTGIGPTVISFKDDE